MGRKWYVVTVGKDSIGVFPTWIEAGPLVKGVSEAIYQSFPTEAEARRLFAQAMAKGTTKVIRDDSSSSRQTTPRPATRNTGYSNNSASPSPRSATSPMLLNTHSYTSRNCSCNCQEPSHSETGRSRHSSQPAPSRSPSSAQVTSPLSRAASEPSSNFDLSRRIEDLFKKDLPVVEVQARVSSRHAQALTPTKSLTEFDSPRTQNLQLPQSAVVETPDWLISYPKARQNQSRPLSPLNSEDIPLNSFASLSMEPARRAVHISRSPATSPSVGDSSIYLSPSPRRIAQVVYQSDVDPRTPIKDKTQVPELAFVNSMSFSKPSPFSGGAELPEQYAANGTPQSSLLFKSSPLSRSAKSVVSLS